MRVKAELTMDVADNESSSDIISEIESYTGGCCNKIAFLNEIQPSEIKKIIDAYESNGEVLDGLNDYKQESFECGYGNAIGYALNTLEVDDDEDVVYYDALQAQKIIDAYESNGETLAELKSDNSYCDFEQGYNNGLEYFCKHAGIALQSEQ